MEKRHYIVCMRNDHLRLIGPFESEDASVEWATRPSSDPERSFVVVNNPKDDPRWQPIEMDGDDVGWDLGPGSFVVEVFKPSDGPMPD